MKGEQDIWDLYNGFLLASDTSRLQKILVRARLLEEALRVPGDVVELGVFKGAGWMFWLKALKILSPSQRRRVIGFDTFASFAGEGLLDYEIQSVSKFVGESHYQGASPDRLLEIARDAGITGGELVVGNVLDTIPQYVRANPGFRIALLHIDLDTYVGTKTALENLYGLVTPGGLIVLDEYGKRGWGESDAVDEFVLRNGLELESIEYSDQPSAIIRKT